MRASTFSFTYAFAAVILLVRQQSANFTLSIEFAQLPRIPLQLCNSSTTLFVLRALSSLRVARAAPLLTTDYFHNKHSHLQKSSLHFVRSLVYLTDEIVREMRRRSHKNVRVRDEMRLTVYYLFHCHVSSYMKSYFNMI